MAVIIVSQEIKKCRIVIASVLKPVDDTRGFEKIAQSLVDRKFEVFLIGQPSQHTATADSPIHFLPLAKFGRLSFARWFSPLEIARKIYQVKPQILIVNTHELLLVAILNRILFGTRILYDVQENYTQNLTHTDAFPPVVRHVLAGWVRLKEWVTSPLLHHFLLAEKSYENEMGFMGKRFSVIENKVQLPGGFRRTPDPEKLKLVFTGTLAENTGVFRAIEFAKQLHALEPKIELELIGFCAQSATVKRIQQAIQNHPFITVKGGTQLVPHGDVFNALATANFGIISYPILPYLKNKIPTKPFEYLGCELPILLQQNEPWTKLAEQFNGGIVLDFDQYDTQQILGKMCKQTFYKDVSALIRSEVLWKSVDHK